MEIPDTTFEIFNGYLLNYMLIFIIEEIKLVLK
jgi:hypothetical protein